MSDMSLTPISPTPADSSELPTVEISFNTSKGGAWDDRELIRASEAAMKEFHIHHPGPGSWLDKATAALAAGKKLPGAEDYGTSWYSASLPDPQPHPQASTSTSTSTSTFIPNPISNPYEKSNQSNKRRRTKKPNGYGYDITNSIINPYAPTSSTSTTNQRRSRNISPSYQPPSPTPNGDLNEEEYDESENYIYDDEDDEEEDEEEYDEDKEWEIPNYSHSQNQNQQQYNNNNNNNGYDQLFPSLGVYPPGGINKEEALGYAMTAQYWAGYWMGVAQSQSQPSQQLQQPQSVQFQKQGQNKNGSGKKRRNRKQVDFDLNADEDEEENIELDALVEPNLQQQGRVNGDNLSNIKITKKHFERPILELRR